MHPKWNSHLPLFVLLLYLLILSSSHQSGSYVPSHIRRKLPKGFTLPTPSCSEPKTSPNLVHHIPRSESSSTSKEMQSNSLCSAVPPPPPLSIIRTVTKFLFLTHSPDHLASYFECFRECVCMLLSSDHPQPSEKCKLTFQLVVGLQPCREAGL